MKLKVTELEALEILYSYANIPYKWGGQSKTGIDCSGLVGEVWAAWGFVADSYDTTADKLFDGYRTGSLKGTKLTQGKFGSLEFYGSGTNAGHVVFGLSPNYIFGANNGNTKMSVPEDAWSHRPPAYTKVYPRNYRSDSLGIWMPDYEFADSATKWFTVTTNLNLRSSASINAGVVTVIPKNEQVYATSQASVNDGTYTWVNVVWGVNVGWVSDKYLS